MQRVLRSVPGGRITPKYLLPCEQFPGMWQHGQHTHVHCPSCSTQVAWTEARRHSSSCPCIIEAVPAGKALERFSWLLVRELGTRVQQRWVVGPDHMQQIFRSNFWVSALEILQRDPTLVCTTATDGADIRLHRSSLMRMSASVLSGNMSVKFTVFGSKR